ncbi:hypothetical protein [Lawsonella clevelandensis]|uniref:Uncharacterized protein n=1 Tax=Lawsonella clevelandensis TaxID=1528099 RepID=A0A0M4MY29_9ACTN|nr:hypothetical protein [Lawsonella clevelandensis]ALE19206.1 hypothetical protein AL705_06035 [Lawsonella clevelandensis]VHO01151.1 hypothetical protein LC603019_01192 [Lawsonella clevelandensis]
MFRNRRSPLSSASQVHPIPASRRQRRFRAPITALVATALVGTTMLSGCGCDDSTNSPSSQSSSTVTSTTQQNGEGAAPATTPNASDDTLSTRSDGSTIALTPALPNGSRTVSPATPPQVIPSTPILAYPAPIQPGSVLPQTNLDSKYAPLGVPVMSPAGPIKPFIIVVSLTREQTVQLHEKQIGEKMTQAGSAVPILGDPVAAMGGALAGSSAFSADHPRTCVRTWVEVHPSGWGTYATYVTGNECPATMIVSGQLPGLAA